MITPSTDKGVALVANELVQRGMHPVTILIDPSSFGADRKSTDLEQLLKEQGISTVRVSKDDNFKAILEGAGKASLPESAFWWKDGNAS